MRKIFFLLVLLGLGIDTGFYAPPVTTAQIAPSITIFHEGSMGSCQVELISPKGVRIFIDVYNHELFRTGDQSQSRLTN